MNFDHSPDKFRKAFALDPGLDAIYSGILMVIHYSAKYSAEEIFHESCRWNPSYGAGITAFQRFTNEQHKEKRLRIGYVSPDFRNHAVSFFCASLLAEHDRSAVEVFCYSNVQKSDDTTRRFERLADEWRNVYGVSDEKLAEMIRSDQIAIMVDLAGHTNGNRLKMFTRKPAPIKVTWLGYPGTTGLSAID